MHYKTNLIVFMLVAASVFVLLLSCGEDDCPVCPECPSEPDYHLLYSYVRPDYEPVDYVVTTYSLKSGLLIDSTYYSCYPFDAVAFSPDGKYSYYTRTASGSCEHHASTWVIDTRTGDTLAIDHEHGGHSITISRDGRYLATSETSYMAIYKVPELVPIFEEILGYKAFESVVLHPREKIVVFARAHIDSLFVYSFESDILEMISAFPHRNLAGDPLFVGGAMSFVPSGDSLVLTAAKGPGALFFQVLNTIDYGIEYELRLAPWQLHQHHAWHPDGKRLFMPWHGGYHNPEMGGIDVYDMSTGTLESFVDANDYNLGAPWFLPRHLAFTPDGKQMVVLNGWGFGTWPVHVIDMATKQIVRDFKHNDFGNTRAMALIPIDWEKEK